jgi:putative molybdopterin biosynthesis protein
MSVYLHDIPLPEAQARFIEALQEANSWRVLGGETIPLDEYALGRVLAETVWAKVSSPHYHASAMDGFAVRASDTSGAQPAAPVTLHIGSFGTASDKVETCYLDTGDALPPEFDSVIPIENVEALDADGNLTPAIRQPAAIRIRASVPPWSHVRPMGEDIVATQLVLPAGHILRPVDLGAIAAAGHHEIRAARKPRIAILPTGTELVPLGSELNPGEILEYNSLVMAAQVISMGAEATRFPIIKDDFDLICTRVQEASRDHDLVLLNAGSSAGAEDFAAKVVEELGDLLVHGVAVRPGHPVILGMIKRETSVVPILGVPGYPVSAALTVEIFVEPVLAKWLGRQPAELPVETATLTRKVVSPAGDDDYIRVAVGRVGEKMLAAPLARGAGVITSLVQADGLMVLPRGTQGIEAGREVQVHLYRPRAELERTIFCVGSHDMTLDLLAQFLSGKARRLVSANVGSQGGLIALGRGEAHLAGSHLLDPASGEYNLSFLPQYLSGVRVQVIGLVRRAQGLLVMRGNPMDLIGLADLTRPGVRFVNRQRGAGTRVLLDYHLSRLGIVPDGIIGYNREEFTHLGIAAAVASGRADCGLGIAAAAQALDLDFVPLFQERYDLIIPVEHAHGSLLAPLLDVIAGPRFRGEVMKLPGYDVSGMGTLISEV